MRQNIQERDIARSSRILERLMKSGEPEKYIFREVTSKKEIADLKEQRKIAYEQARLSGASSDDFFDDYQTRYFTLSLNDKEKTLLRAGRAVDLCLSPAKMNLLPQKDLEDVFIETKRHNNFWRQSSLSYEDVTEVSKFLGKYEHMDRTYEISGLFGNGALSDKTPGINHLLFCLGIGKFGFDEKWPLVVTTQNPVHANAYRKTGFPYKVLAEGMPFSDYCGRPAVMLCLEGKEFSEVFEKHFNKYAEKLFRKV